jgi:glycosyltransferase involved in cell wall biosynthesis
MEKTTVLHLITELNVGGAERVVQRLATQLSKRRYKVLVACLYDLGAVADEIIAAGVPVVNLDMRGKSDLRVVYRLVRLLRKEKIQILQSHLFHANLLAAIVGKLSNVPVIIATRQNVDIGGVGRERVNRWALRSCDAVVAVSKEVYKAEIQHSQTDPAKVVVIPNTVQVEAFTGVNQAQVEMLRQEWNIHPSRPVIGTVARFDRQKGHVYLIDATIKILKQIPSTKILLVGDGPLRPQMEDKAEALGLSDSIIFTGIRHDVQKILALLDLFVLPSLWEGLPVALLEAMAAGLPVVATAAGGTPEAVVDGTTGLLVPPRDPLALAKAITRLLNDPELRRQMGQAGQKRVIEHFSVERMVEQTQNLYEHLLDKKGL